MRRDVKAFAIYFPCVGSINYVNYSQMSNQRAVSVKSSNFFLGMKSAGLMLDVEASYEL